MTLENIEKRSLKMMEEHGLANWTFAFDRANGRLGCTFWYSKRITISKQFALRNPWKTVRETMLHEIAHALCEVTDGHNKAWAEMYKGLGGTLNRDYSGIRVAPLKKGRCPNCKKEHKARIRKDVACSDCCRKYNNGSYSLKYKIRWSR